MNIRLRKNSDVQLLELRGELRLGEPLNELKQTIDDLLVRGENRIVIELSGVPMIDSSGIGLLVKSLATARQRGGSVKLVKPSDFAVKTLRIVGVLNLFQVYQDESEAVQSFAA